MGTGVLDREKRDVKTTQPKLERKRIRTKSTPSRKSQKGRPSNKKTAQERRHELAEMVERVSKIEHLLTF